MKNFFRTLAIVALGFFATSCVSADVDDVQMSSGEGVVNFTVSTPGATSRAIADGKSATQLTCGVYDAEWNYLTTVTGQFDGSSLTTTVSIRLVNKKVYNFVFWAQDPDADCYTLTLDHADGPNVAVTYNGVANDESRDAFFGQLTDLQVNGTMNEKVELTRPFAQVNFGTLDTELAKVAGFDITVAEAKTTVTTRAYNTLYLGNGQHGAVGGAQDVQVTFSDAALPNEDLYLLNDTEHTTPYDWLAMNYILVPEAEGSLSECTLVVKDNKGQSVEVKYPNAPVKRNWRTNLVGNLLTDQVVIEVEILPIPEGEYNNEGTFASQLAAGGSILLKSDVVLDDNAAGLVIDKDTEIDLNGYTIVHPDTEASRASSSKAAMFTVEGDANLTIKNGKLVIESTNGVVSGTGTSTGAANVVVFNSTGNLKIDDVTVEGSKRGGWRAVEVMSGSAVISNSTFNCYYGSAVNSSNADVTLNDCDITVTGMYSAPYNSVCFSVMYGGKLTVNGGNYKMINNNTFATGDTHGGWLGIVMSSGGTIILNDGTFENVPADGFVPAYERAIIEAENNAPAVSTVVFAGGKYKPQHSKVYSGYGDQYYPTWVNADKLTLGEDGWYTVADNKGYVVNGDEYLVSTGAGLAAAVVDAPANAKISLTADVDLTGVEYTPRSFSKLVFEGNNHTISGVKVENALQAALFGKTWNFDIKNVTLANSTFVGKNIDDEDAAAGFIGFFQAIGGNGKFTNCHIENCTIGSAKYVGGIIAYKNGTPSLEITDCSVKNSTFISKYTENNGVLYKGHCGGLVGLIDATQITNCVVANNTFDVLGARGGLFIGSAQHNSAVSGKVENNTGLLMLCGEVNNIADWSNVEYNFQASNAAELKAGIAANFKTIYIKGQIDLTEEILAGYNGTIIGADEAACLNTRTFNVIAADEAYHLSDKTINFKNITIKVPTEDGDFLKTGFVAAGTKIFDNCVFEGQVTLNGSATWTFNECEFGGADNGAYASFVYGATKATFNDCSFSGVDRAAKVYAAGGAIEAEYNNCTFTSTTSNKYAVNIDASCATTKVALNGCSQTGMPGLFAVTGSKAIVTVNGAEYVGNGLYKSGSTYKVENAEGLALLNSKLVEMSVGRDVAIELLANIDFTGKTWTPVKSHIDWNNTVNSINGNGYTISNLTVNGKAMFTIFANAHDVVVKDITFDNAQVNTSDINAAVIVGQTYNNLLLENVDVKNSTIVGGYKVAALVGTVYNEDASTITATLKGCDVINTTVKSTQYDFCTTGMVAFVNAGNNDTIQFENCTIDGLKLYGPTTYGYKAHAAIYTTGSESLFNEAEGVTVTNVTFENI